MFKPYNTLIASIYILALFVGGCSDDTSAPEADPDILLTLYFGDNFFANYGSGHLVFASDPSGQLLDVGDWTDTDTVILRNEDIHPETVSLTLVIYGDFGLYMVTDMGIAPGSQLIFTDKQSSEAPGTVELTFLNAPNCQKYRISQNGGYQGGTGPLPSTKTINLYRGPSNIFVRIDPEDSAPLGGWLWGMEPNSSATMDFDEAETAQVLRGRLVQIPEGIKTISCEIKTIDRSDAAMTDIILESISLNEEIPGSLHIHYPEVFYSYVLTSFSMYTHDEPQRFYSQDSIGAVPGRFEKMPGTLTMTNTEVDSLAFTMTGYWDNFESYWSIGEEYSASWSILGNDPIQNFALPQLPVEITELYPEFPRENFIFRGLTTTFGSIESGARMQQGIHMPYLQNDESISLNILHKIQKQFASRSQ